MATRCSYIHGARILLVSDDEGDEQRRSRQATLHERNRNMDGIHISDDDVVSLDNVSTGVAGLRTVFVNVFGIVDGSGWTLVDAGLYGAAGRIQRWAADRFDSPPDAIVLTHAHFDHVGALQTLADGWNVPVYAHPREIDCLTGSASYPPPDPAAGGGLMAGLSVLYPRKPSHFEGDARPLPADGSLPSLPSWQWLHTPGHCDGHVSFFRSTDRTLVAGDAFCTTKQESFLAIAAQRPELHGPPAYFTTDWRAARESTMQLAALEPMWIAPGHGQLIAGIDAAAALMVLAQRFDEIARPTRGKYANGGPAHPGARLGS